MSEFATSTTTTPRPRLIIGDVKMNQLQTKSPAAESAETQPKNSESPAAVGSHVHLVSHDTSKSAEIKFPAKNWQLPPALLAARIKSTGLDTARELNSVEDDTLEEALELFSKTHDQLKSPHAMSIGPRNKSSISMADVLQKAFGETKPKPQMTFMDRQKFRATFATHKADPQQIIPLPPTPFGDETDMDLLQESLRNRHLLPSPIVPVPIITNPALAVPGPLSHLPTEMIVYSKQTTLMPNYVGLDPNYKLDLCCKKQGVTPVCQTMCNFDTFTDRSLVTAVISNQCPGPQLGQAFDCASTKVDHTECCTRNNVHLYNAGQCMPFCRTHEPTPPNIFTYVACLSVFDTIKNCYREYQYTHPNIFGD
uniref:DB domain-containing protein n=2 Tax=Bursaphelenchus xylophilus TaxID=6326 RepID=A0A1I7RYR1_BURXY